jgi:hypothetical protein
MAGWNLLFLDKKPFVVDTAKSMGGTAAPTWRRAWPTAPPAIRRAMR